MTQNKDLCTQTHTCYRCKKPTLCQTYTWACPWINEDEDQMCDLCMDLSAREMLQYEAELLDEEGHWLKDA